VSYVSLTEKGLALIVLENELDNLTTAKRRWERRRREADDELKAVAERQQALMATIRTILRGE
jgi:hypothetical protein